MADKISRDSAELGRAVHDLIDRCIKGEVIEGCSIGEYPARLFKLWFNWFNQEEVKVLEAELHVVSKKKKFHGSLDAIIERDGKRFLTDWKVSKSSDPLRVLQLAGYAYAYWEQTGIKIDDGLIVRIDPVKETVSEKTYKNLWKTTKDFLKIKAAYDVLQKIKRGTKND